MAWWEKLAGRKSSPAKVTAPRQIIRRGGGARAQYDGATQGRRAAGWRRTLLDANGELSPAAMGALRGIARDLVRNNPFAARGVSAIANNLVGTGITFQIYRAGQIDQRLTDLARRHFDGLTCDASGRHDLYGLQLQAARAIVESGAVLLRRRWRRVSDGLPVPFQLQVLEPDYIDPSRNGALASAPGVNGGYVIHGVQFSPIGQREGYWLYAGHPGGGTSRSLGSSFVAAEDVAHVFRADRPEQEHGATWFAPIVLRMKDFSDYEDAQLSRQKIAASWAGFVYGEDGTDANPALLGQEDGVEREPIDFVEGGTVSYLGQNERIEFPDPPGVDGYADYTRVSLRAIAAGLGVPYEALTGDLSNVNFSSGRMGWLEFQRSLAAWQWDMFIPQFCDSAARWFLQAAEMIGEDVRGAAFEWTPPGREMIDPATEISSTRDAIRAGLDTISAAAKRRGVDPDKFLAEFKADMDKLDELGLVLDSDPRKVSAAGLMQARPAGAATSSNRSE